MFVIKETMMMLPIADGYDLPVSYFLAGADHYRGDIYGESRVISIEMARESRLVFVATDHHHTHHIIPPTTVSATHIRKSHQKERKAKAQSLRNDITRQLV